MHRCVHRKRNEVSLGSNRWRESVRGTATYTACADEWTWWAGKAGWEEGGKELFERGRRRRRGRSASERMSQRLEVAEVERESIRTYDTKGEREGREEEGEGRRCRSWRMLVVGGEEGEGKVALDFVPEFIFPTPMIASSLFLRSRPLVLRSSLLSALARPLSTTTLPLLASARPTRRRRTAQEFLAVPRRAPAATPPPPGQTGSPILEQARQVLVDVPEDSRGVLKSTPLLSSGKIGRAHV